MTPGTLLAVAVIVAFAGFAQTVAGFGFSLLAVPPLGLIIDPKDAVAVALVGLLVNSLGLTWSERDHVDWAAVRWLLIGAIPGLPLGLLMLQAASVDTLRFALATAVVVSVVFLLSGFSFRTESRVVEAGAGFLTGALTTSLNTNGPPTVLALQARRLEPHEFRPTTSAVLGLTSLVGAVMFAAAGRFTGDVGAAIAVAMPALGVGWIIGTRVRRRVPANLFRSIILTLLVVAAGATVAAALG